MSLFILIQMRNFIKKKKFKWVLSESPRHGTRDKSVIGLKKRIMAKFTLILLSSVYKRLKISED